MTKTTIYLAKIIKPNDYSIDTTIELEAFDSLEKAKAFMDAMGMVEVNWGWTSPASDMEGSIDILKVK